MTRLPDKQFFKIGEVSRITGVKPHVLRYWETEFSSIRPQKTKTNQRLYRRRDVELLLQVKQLLYQEGFTIAGANRRLRELHAEAEVRRREEHRERQVEPDRSAKPPDPELGSMPAAGPTQPSRPDQPLVPDQPATAGESGELRRMADRVRSELREILALVEGDD